MAQYIICTENKEFSYHGTTKVGNNKMHYITKCHSGVKVFDNQGDCSNLLVELLQHPKNILWQLHAGYNGADIKALIGSLQVLKLEDYEK